MKKLLVLAVTLVTGAMAAASSAGTTDSPRSGELHVTKACSDYHGNPGEFCTIRSSSLKTIDVGSKVIYVQAAGAAGLDSDIVLDTGPGNRAFGHVTLSFATLSGVVTFSGGTGQFRHFQARVEVTYDAGEDLWHWDGTYSFRPLDD
jgi:hypothetical protein